MTLALPTYREQAMARMQEVTPRLQQRAQQQLERIPEELTTQLQQRLEMALQEVETEATARLKQDFAFLDNEERIEQLGTQLVDQMSEAAEGIEQRMQAIQDAETQRLADVLNKFDIRSAGEDQAELSRQLVENLLTLALHIVQNPEAAGIGGALSPRTLDPLHHPPQRQHRRKECPMSDVQTYDAGDTPPATTPASTTPTAASTVQLADVERDLDAAVRSAKKKRNLTAIVLGLLLLLTIGYLSFAYSQIQGLDARTTVALVETQVQPILDRPASAWAQQLEAQAPTLIDQAEQAALQLPEAAADGAIRFVTQQFDQRLPDAKASVLDMVDQLAQQTKELAEEQYGTTDLNEQQVQELVDNAAEQFEASLSRELERIYDRYRAASGELVSYLDRLASARPGELDRTQQLHKQIIVSFLSLAQSWQEQRPQLAPASVSSLIGQ